MRAAIGVTLAIARREFAAAFATPVAPVFLATFLLLQGVLTFNPGGFLDRDQADLAAFFDFLPWLLLLLVPALTMRLWAEERRLGTIEWLLTLPVTPGQAVVGKFLAAWAFCTIALALTFPFVVTVNLLGHPDNGVIATGYLGGVLLAGAFLAIGCAASASTKNQVVAFTLALALCFLFAIAATPLVDGFLASHVPGLSGFARRISLASRFQNFARGVIETRDLLFFASFISFWLFATEVIVTHRRAA